MSLICKFLYAEQRNGFTARIGIGADYIQHKARTTNINGVAMSLNGELGWIWRDYAKINFLISHGAGPNDIKGEYPINATNLSNLSFSGGLFYVIRLESKGGYNIASAFGHWEHTCYINVGLETTSLLHAATYVPYLTSMDIVNAFVELERRKSIGEKWSIEYLGRLSVSNATLTLGASTANIIQTQKELTSQNIFGYGVKVGLGIHYKFSKRAYFFTNVLVTYQFINKAEPKTLTTKATPETNGIQANQTSIVQYPDSNTLYTGLQFGFGF
ncbi:hypothetical protein CQA66_04680 [Helicobacter aurati]|uniref:Uncharacterized protein n=1 Tax=Helicobacter aurati TaxID=137778 RepID=A0A3D8J6Z3_9HELI|nr:hypothetical protein CQA66_04680 [Helicobacter aurati]